MNLKDYTTYFLKLARAKIYLVIFLSLFLQSLYSQNEIKETDPTLTTDSTFVMHKSPWGAVLRSALLPGLGQIYNESYWKVPVVLGAFYYLIDIWIRNNDEYKLYSDLYIASGFSNVNYKKWRDFRHDQRDEFAIYIGLVYFLNLVDAYVDAQLFDFDVSENKMINTYQLNLRVKL